MPTYVEPWDPEVPAGSEARSLGDDRIRQFKRAMDERLNTDHVKPSDESGVTTVGYHRKSTYIKLADNATPVADTVIVYGKDSSGTTELFAIDEDGNTTQLTAAGREPLTLSDVYPIGCIYTTVVSTNPSVIFGFGTWTAFGAGKVLVGLDGAQTEFDTVEETGGSKTHTLSTAEIPAHTHTVFAQTVGAVGLGEYRIANSGDTFTSGSTGGGGAHNNLQPYIVVYFFKRTA